ncbi:MAG TPA: gephyrin-like molybdotransferase Glp [Solirubrobacteraceae bacterium]|jgi:molybdopterin molybdotransferase
MAGLLSVAAARDAIAAAVRPLPHEPVALADALGRVLAEDVVAAGDVPPFANAAMDGYAVQAGTGGRTLRVVGESRAGAPPDVAVGEGDAVRISTGAPMPEGADGVLAVERVEVADGLVTLGADVAPGLNVREPGEDVRRGDVVLVAGTRLGPAELGVAVSAGRGAVECARRPRVSVVATGDELAPPGAPLRPGQIHNSNAVTLRALAAGAGAVARVVPGVPDTIEATEAALRGALEGADVVLVSGGVSVGPHDHVKPALERLGAQERFWRVALRPGKPTWFGVRGEALVFGLPGNPVSAMVTFALFARPALAAMQGEPFAAERRTALLAEDVPRRAERDEAVRVRLRTGDDGVLRAEPTGPQGSHQLRSMLGADGLAIVEAGEGDLPAGTPVAVEPL